MLSILMTKIQIYIIMLRCASSDPTLSLPADEVKSGEEDQREVRQPDSRCEGGDGRARRAAGQRQWGRQ